MLSVHQHWDPLKVCAVGRCYPPEYFNYIKNQKVRGVFHRIAEETEEDYQKLISLLEKFDVKVIRNDISDNPEDHFRPNGTMISPPMVPRDYTAMIGNKFFLPGKDFGKNIDIEYELKSIMTTSSLEMNNISNFHKDLLNYVYDLTFPGRPVSMTGQAMLMKTVRGMKEGNVRKLLEAIDTDDLKNVIFQGYTNTIGKTSKYTHDDKTYPYKTLEKFVKDSGNEIVYDQYINTASTIRVGKDLFFALGNIVTKMKEDTFMNKWRKLFPDYNIHPVSLPGHSDGNLCPVKPGLLVSLNSAKTYADTFPDWEVVTVEGEGFHKVKPFIDKKKKVRNRYYVPDADDLFYDYVNEWMDDWVTYVEETVFDVNMLVIDEKNVVCNNVNKKVFDAFERHGITPHIVNFRHRYFWDGGLHCITSDIAREGERKDYHINV
tara:strand:- start:208 stop:1503 length:1296 start_codon:yes stop_codon:yes gene_type:complete